METDKRRTKGRAFAAYVEDGMAVVEAALLGGAQIDRHGNLNTTVIGRYDAPKARLPGSGGASEIASNAQRTFTIMQLSRRAFLEQLDFVTSLGHLAGGDAGRRLGLRHEGPARVISGKALFDFDNDEREMQLVSLHLGATLGEVRSSVGWPLRVAPGVGQTPAPTEEELRLMRHEFDPRGLYRQPVALDMRSAVRRAPRDCVDLVQSVVHALLPLGPAAYRALPRRGSYFLPAAPAQDTGAACLPAPLS